MRFQPGFSGRRKPFVVTHVTQGTRNTSSNNSTINNVPIGPATPDRMTLICTTEMWGLHRVRFNGIDAAPLNAPGSFLQTNWWSLATGQALAGLTEADIRFDTADRVSLGYTLFHVTGGPRPLPLIDAIRDGLRPASNASLIKSAKAAALGGWTSGTNVGGITWTGLDEVTDFNYTTGLTGPSSRRHSASMLATEENGVLGVAITPDMLQAQGTVLTIGKDRSPSCVPAYAGTVERTTSGANVELSDVPFGALPAEGEDRHLALIVTGLANNTTSRVLLNAELAGVAHANPAGRIRNWQNGRSFVAIHVLPAPAEAGTEGTVGLEFSVSMTRFALTTVRLSRYLLANRPSDFSTANPLVSRLPAGKGAVFLAGGYNRDTGAFTPTGIDEIVQQEFSGDRYFAGMKTGLGSLAAHEVSVALGSNTDRVLVGAVVR